MDHIFISHSHKDAIFANRLASKLKRMGREVWIYSDDIKASDNLVVSIDDALNGCNVFVLLWSENAQKSDWVNLEWGAALVNKKKIITCRLDQTPLPSFLQVKSYIEFSDFKKGCSALVKSLN